MNFPRPVTQIHEIELSSRCNLACTYCPNPTMSREKLDMSEDVYFQALSVVNHYVSRGTQGELALTGVGEALLNPYFADAVLMAREIIGDRLLTFSTNGILLTDELIDKIKPAKPVIYVSLHRPEVAALAIDRCRKHGLQVGHNHSFATSSLNWVQDVDWYVSSTPSTCEYLRSGWAVIRADGTIGTCCWDAETKVSKIGTVWDDPESLVTAPHEACKKCSLLVPEAA